MKLLGIVILYYPDDTLVDNIGSYIGGVDKLIVWENSPAHSNGEIPESEKIIKMGNGENAGIGKALNEAIKYAQTNGFTHLLTMDQDSRFEKDHFSKYRSLVEKNNEKTIFTPNYIIGGRSLYYTHDTFMEDNSGGQCLSGSIYPLSIFCETGLFRDDLMVDGVDTEMNYRAKKQGVHTKITLPVLLHHQLGPPSKTYTFLGLSVNASCERPAQRAYYLVRNHILIKKLYSQHDPDLFYTFYKRLFVVVFFEKDKRIKLKGLIMGYIHGKMGRTGEYTLK
ncbi:glycosyl transferase [Bacteroidia bacterium]|nr:glycosyl transferase [Bacteroidia bacterium]